MRALNHLKTSGKSHWLAACLFLDLSTALSASRDSYAAGHEWPAYNGSQTNSHYSDLALINRNNIAGLKKAWEYRSGDGPPPGWYSFNPLIVDGRMYVATAGGALTALDPATGKEFWRFTPPLAMHSRGASYWRDPEHGRGRILFFGGSEDLDGGTDLYAIDAASGQAIASFGDRGRVPMGVPVTSPGVIYKDLIILGSSNGKRGSGQIRAYDLRSGSMRWIFRTIPARGEAGAETWGKLGPEKANGANCWAGMAVDVERGLVFASTSQPKVELRGLDFFGGDWQGRNRFSDSVIALQAESGKLVWDFQETHHDIWDYDLPAPPNLVRISYHGNEVDAVAQVTKRGNTLLLNRDTGALLYPSISRPAPRSDIPGEQTYPTQQIFPFPQPFADIVFARQNVTDLNPAAHAYILERFKFARTGWFAPPSLQGNILFGVNGGAEWGGAAFDPVTHLLYVNANHTPWFVQIKKNSGGADIKAAGHGSQESANASPEQLKQGAAHYLKNCASCHGVTRNGQGGGVPLRSLARKYSSEEIATISLKGRGRMPPIGAQLSKEVNQSIATYLWNVDRSLGHGLFQSGTDTDYVPAYTSTFSLLLDQEGYPGSKPPWGTLNAINLDTGKIEWRVPLGEYPDLKKKAVPPTGTPNFGGSVLTAGGLLFIAATADEKLRAFDKQTGKVLWEAQLPFGGYATPATYAVNGRQYVVIAAGGGQNNGQRGDAYIAFALEEAR